MIKRLQRVLRIFIWILAVFIIILFGAYFFVQTETFNKFILEYTISKLNQSWEVNESKVNIESVNGNLLEGIRANNGSIVVREDTLLYFRYLDLKYDLWGLLNHEIKVEHAIINSPQINLLKVKNNKDSLVWNFMSIFSSSQEKDTTVSEFDWDLTFEKLRLENGHLKVAGSMDTTNPDWKYSIAKLDTFDFNNLNVTNLELDMTASYFRNYKNISINNLSFNTNSDFNLRKFTMKTNINMKDTVSDIWAFEMITDKSEIKIDRLHIEQFSPFNKIVYDNWGTKNFDVSLNIVKFNFDELKFFLPELSFLDSTVGLTLNADKRYGDVNINYLKVILPNSEIKIKGNVKNLNYPDDLFIDAHIDSIQLNPHDVRTVIKDPSIPDYNNLGMVYGNIYFQGKPDNFYSEYELTTGAGYVKGNTTFDLNYESFNGYVTAHRLNLGKILKSRGLNSNLNLAAKFSGNGFTPNKINANIKYSLSTSSIAGLRINRSSGSVNARGYTLTLNTNTNSSAGNASVSGRINIANPNNPVYSLKGRLTSFDISQITKNPDNKSSLNVTFDINGRGTNLNNINGQYNFNIDQSSFAGQEIPITPINVEIKNGGLESSILISSDMADLNATGKFDIESLNNAVQTNLSSFIDVINNKFNFGAESQRITPASGGFITRDLNVIYNLVIKDTARLNQVMQPFGITFNGDVNGSINNNPNGFRTEMLLNIKDFKYQDTVIVLKNLNSDLTFQNDYSGNSGNSFSQYTIILAANGDQVILNDSKIDSVWIGLNMENSLANIAGSARLDTMKFGRIASKLDLGENEITANIDSLFIKYDQYEVANQNIWQLSYIPQQEIKVEQMGIKSKNAIVNVSGNYSFDGNSNLTLNGNDLNISDVYDIIYPPDTTNIVGNKPTYPVSGNISQFSINLKNTIDNPEINLIVATNTLKYQNDNIGTINANLTYKNELLTPNISFENANNKGSLNLSGEIPYKNPLVQQETVIQFYDNPVNLTLAANNFQVGSFSKLYPAIGSLRGVLKGQITAAGTVSNPNLTGSLIVNDGSYYLDLTGMDYNFDLNISTANSKLVIDKITLYHTGERQRHFDFTGNVDFSGMKINDIDLTGTGNLVLLDDYADENQMQVSGFFYAGTGSQPIRIKGNFEKLDVNGDFLIKDATISSLPLKGSGYNPGEDKFLYITKLPDSLAKKPDSSIAVTSTEFEKINPFERYKFTVSKKQPGLMDFLNLDIGVKTEKNIYLSIDFNNLTRDRLYGEVNADMRIKTEDKQFNAYGTVEVAGNSYYRFYKEFKLNESRMVFNGPITEPDLDIRAVYSGTKVTEQHGVTSNTPVQIVLTLKGKVENPEIALRLIEDGTEVTGSDAQADAVTFLLFGKYKSELSLSERTAVASSVGTSVGSLYASSFLSDAVREVLPFIVDAEFIYSGGDVPVTGVQLTSEIAGATVKVGNRQVKDVNYFEFTIDYPLNGMFGFKLPETLLLEISKQEANDVLTSESSGNTVVRYSTGVKLVYKFKF